MTAGADLDLFGDEARAGRFQRCHGVRQVGDVDGNMVQPFSALLEKLGNHRIGACGFQDFDPAFAHRNHGYPDLFMCDNFFAHHAEPKLLVKLASLLERFNGNSEMIDHVGHDGSSWLLATSAWLLAGRSYFDVLGVSVLLP